MLETPGAMLSFKEYKWTAGQIYALKRVATSYFDEVNEDLAKEE